ncbi:MAG: tetratricopeptide repeat protein, partial [Desulfobulbaceae bacterium]|nr:tetratricopeptide repeat protein [Desulfobulbaceae bacterium]
MMKKLRYCLLPLIFVVSFAAQCYGKSMVGITAPGFSLKDVYGKQRSLSEMSKHSLIVLYFFSLDSQASFEGLLTLADIKKQYGHSELDVWGITRTDREAVSDFVLTNGITFPVFPDEGEVSDLYDAGLILPVTVIIGPQMKIIDYLQGGGRSTEEMLLRLAQRELQRDETLLAKAIGLEVQKKNPSSIEAKSVHGYAALKEEKYDEAQQVFRELAGADSEAEIIGKEGLAAVYAKKGETKNALETIKAVEEKAPERGYAHLVKADILYGRDEKEQAAAEYEKAVRTPEAYPHQKSLAYNQLGRLETERGNYNRARELYDQAIDIDPYYIEAMSNKGVAHQKEGNWNEALLDFQKAMQVDATDPFTEVLAAKAREMVELQRDVARRER